MRKVVFPGCMTEFIIQFVKGNRYITNGSAKFWTQHQYRNVINGKKPTSVRFLFFFIMDM